MEIEFRGWTGSEMVYDNQDKIVKPNHLRSVDDKYFSKPRVYHNQIQVWFYESRLPHATTEHFDHITYIPQTFVMQFTGIKDKNGVKIFEGDKVKFHYFYNGLSEGLGVEEREQSLDGIIVWGQYGWALSAIRGQHWEGYTGYASGEGESSIVELCGMSEGAIHEESFEVIGNIHENPELLK